MKFENYMILDFPSKSSNEAFARSAVACFAAQLDPTLEELGDIRTAVSEAVTNCIVHAYPDELGVITVRCRILKGQTLDIVVKDKGIGISDIDQARKPMFTTGGTERRQQKACPSEKAYFPNTLRLRPENQRIPLKSE